MLVVILVIIGLRLVWVLLVMGVSIASLFSNLSRSVMATIHQHTVYHPNISKSSTNPN